MIPQEWRRHKEFDNIHKLDGVAVITVQLRYNGWITEMQNPEMQHNLQEVHTASHLSPPSRPPLCQVTQRLTLIKHAPAVIGSAACNRGALVKVRSIAVPVWHNSISLSHARILTRMKGSISSRVHFGLYVCFSQLSPFHQGTLAGLPAAVAVASLGARLSCSSLSLGPDSCLAKDGKPA